MDDNLATAKSAAVQWSSVSRPRSRNRDSLGEESTTRKMQDTVDYLHVGDSLSCDPEGGDSDRKIAIQDN